jgi:diguanylate cyclase (GGDEF)-like protein
MPTAIYTGTSVRPNFIALVVMLGILIGGTWGTAKFTIDSLLYRDATSAAQKWAKYLAESVGDLEQVAAGERPSSASMTFFKAVQKSSDVFRYEIFNREGYSQLISDSKNIRSVDLSEYSTEAARSVSIRQPIVDIIDGASPEWPSFYARAYLPIIADQRVIAIVGAYVDQTQLRDQFYLTFLNAATVLCILTGLAFAIPLVAWYRWTKEKHDLDRRIRYLAHHDALTGLENRSQLVETMNTAFAGLPVHAGGFSVHFIDVDRFKDFNDSYGHAGGDFVLKTIAERLRVVTRRDDVIARIGGDEFVVIQSNVFVKDDTEKFAQRLSSAVNAPMQFNEVTIAPTVSIGVALAPVDGNNPERLLKSADLALYKSKADGRNCIRFFQPEMDAELQSRLTIERMIRDAVLHDRFVLHYQPIYEMSGRRLNGYEALIRLPKEDGTLVPPATFIPVAEELRLIDKIGAWVLREACGTAVTWPDHLTVAVNLSPAQFLAGNISEIVAAALKESGLPAHRLELEITETLLLGNTESVIAELQRIKAMGAAIVMDDFGTGYSSLSYLWRFPFDKIKIDRSFMQDFGTSGRDARRVLKTIIALGRELNMRVTVEGIETAEQVAFLAQTNGDEVQGFFFGRPIPASEIPASGIPSEILSGFQKAFLTSSSPTAQEATANKTKVRERQLGGK